MCKNCIDGSSQSINVGVRVTITLSKDVVVAISDYNLTIDRTEDGNFVYPNFDDADFKEAVLEQVDVPMPNGWAVEEFVVEES